MEALLYLDVDFVVVLLCVLHLWNFEKREIDRQGGTRLNKTEQNYYDLLKVLQVFRIVFAHVVVHPSQIYSQ